MKSQLAIKLKELLDGMSKEDFNQDWEKIQSLNLSGPSLSDALNYFVVNQSNTSSFELVDTENDVTSYLTNFNYNNAA